MTGHPHISIYIVVRQGKAGAMLIGVDHKKSDFWLRDQLTFYNKLINFRHYIISKVLPHAIYFFLSPFIYYTVTS